MSSPEQLSVILNSFLSKKGYLSSCKELDVIYRWKNIVGDTIYSVSKCNNIEDGILYVKIDNASWRQELSFIKNEILKKIYFETRCKSIRDIIFY